MEVAEPTRAKYTYLLRGRPIDCSTNLGRPEHDRYPKE